MNNHPNAPLPQLLYINQPRSQFWPPGPNQAPSRVSLPSFAEFLRASGLEPPTNSSHDQIEKPPGRAPKGSSYVCSQHPHFNGTLNVENSSANANQSLPLNPCRSTNCSLPDNPIPSFRLDPSGKATSAPSPQLKLTHPNQLRPQFFPKATRCIASAPSRLRTGASPVTPHAAVPRITQGWPSKNLLQVVWPSLPSNPRLSFGPDQPCLVHPTTPQHSSHVVNCPAPQRNNKQKPETQSTSQISTDTTSTVPTTPEDSKNSLLGAKQKTNSKKIESVGAKKSKSFPCTADGCNSVLRSAYSYKVHMKTVHEKIKDHTCFFVECDRKFGQAQHRNRHMREVHGVNPTGRVIRKLRRSKLPHAAAEWGPK